MNGSSPSDRDELDVLRRNDFGSYQPINGWSVAIIVGARKLSSRQTNLVIFRHERSIEFAVLNGLIRNDDARVSLLERRAAKATVVLHAKEHWARSELHHEVVVEAVHDSIQEAEAHSSGRRMSDMHVPKERDVASHPCKGTKMAQRMSSQ